MSRYKEIMKEIKEIEEEIEAECIEEGYPARGSNFELRFEQATAELYAELYELDEMEG